VAGNVVGFDRYTTGLLLSEMVMEHVICDWFMTCFWDLTRGSETGLLDKSAEYRLNPFHLGMILLAPKPGGDFIPTLRTDQRAVHEFVAVRATRMKDSSDGFGELVTLAPADFSDPLSLPPLTMTQWVWAPATTGGR